MLSTVLGEKGESQLILVINELAKSLDNGDQIDVILLDFQKAFEKVPHEKLLVKLQQCGIRGQLRTQAG